MRLPNQMSSYSLPSCLMALLEALPSHQVCPTSGPLHLLVPGSGKHFAQLFAWPLPFSHSDLWFIVTTSERPYLTSLSKIVPPFDLLFLLSLFYISPLPAVKLCIQFCLFLLVHCLSCPCEGQDVVLFTTVFPLPRTVPVFNA